MDKPWSVDWKKLFHLISCLMQAPHANLTQCLKCTLKHCTWALCSCSLPPLQLTGFAQSYRYCRSVPRVLTPYPPPSVATGDISSVEILCRNIWDSACEIWLGICPSLSPCQHLSTRHYHTALVTGPGPCRPVDHQAWSYQLYYYPSFYLLLLLTISN